jgi:S-adenosylmethionine:tRNA ribosyltransferase-isomerase
MSQLSQFNTYHVPPELIAQTPAKPRDSSRLLVVRRDSGAISHHIFRELPDLLDESYALVVNNSKVINARLEGILADGCGQTLYLLKQTSARQWQVSGDGLDALTPGTTLGFANSPLIATVLKLDSEESALLEFTGCDDLRGELSRIGKVPLPPYIADDSGADQYQTVYAKQDGSVAAPTAGLHFTPQVLDRLTQRGIAREEVTLHVGFGTFAHVHAEDLAAHDMHSEVYTLDDAVAERLVRYKQQGKKILTVGTTATRVIESCSDADGVLRAGSGETDIFIYPPYQFKFADALLTNFHMPGLTPIMLVAAFTGYELTMQAYEIAIAERYRFYSFGDAMLIL